MLSNLNVLFSVIIATQDPDFYEKYLNVMLWLGRCADIRICRNFDPEVKTVKKEVNLRTTVYVIGEVSKKYIQ